MTSSARSTVPWSFSEYVDAYKHDRKVVESFVHPVLAYVGHGALLEGQAAYRTELADAAPRGPRLVLAESESDRDRPSSALSSRASSKLTAGPVASPTTTAAQRQGTADSWGYLFPVVKRAGAAFAEHIGVGRASNVDVWLPLGQLSKFHAYFVREGSRFWLADAGSKNGTWLNGARLAAKSPAELGQRNTVRFGPHEFIFLAADGLATAVRLGRLDVGTSGQRP